MDKGDMILILTFWKSFSTVTFSRLLTLPEIEKPTIEAWPVQVYLQPKGSEYVERPAHRRCYNLNGEGIQNQLEAHLKKIPRHSPE